jgi:hypothetical protein
LLQKMWILLSRQGPIARLKRYRKLPNGRRIRRCIKPNEGFAMSNLDYADHGTGIALDDRAGEEKPILVMGGSWRRSLPTWAGTVFLVCLAGTGIMGLSYFTSHVTDAHDRALATEDQPGGGVITRSVMRDLWVFPSFVELAKCRSRPERINSFEDLKRSLEIRDQERLWYAVTFRAHQADGRVVDLTFVRQPYRDPEHFAEFLTILSLASGVAPLEAVDESSPATVNLLPESVLGREPLEVMAELLGEP